jgi:phage FluMu protein Com
MPIRFRCAYCNQLMGIARRKAGTVVNCPNCQGQVVVPAPEPEAEEAAVPPASPQPAPGVFDASNFGQELLQGNGPAPSPGAPAPPAWHQPLPRPAADYFDVEPLPPATAPPRGWIISPPVLILLGLFVALLMGMSFFIGLLVGRSG